MYVEYVKNVVRLKGYNIGDVMFDLKMTFIAFCLLLIIIVFVLNVIIWQDKKIKLKEVIFLSVGECFAIMIMFMLLYNRVIGV